MKYNYFFRSHFGAMSAKAIMIMSVFIGLLLLLGDHGTPRVQYLGGGALSPQKGQFLFRFSRLMDEKSVEQGFTIKPNLPGKMSWSGRTFAYTPDKSIAYAETYTITFSGALDRDHRSMPQSSWKIPTTPVAFAYLGSTGSDGGRIVLHATDGSNHRIVTSDLLLVQSFEVSLDGQYIAYLAATKGTDLQDRKSFHLHVLHLADNTDQVVVTDNNWILDNLRWLPDSSGIGFTYVNFSGTQEGIELYTLSNNKLQAVAVGKARAYPYYFSPDSSQLAYIDTNGALILGTIPDGNGSLVATTFTEMSGFDPVGKYLAYIAPRSVSTFDLTNIPILMGNNGEEMKIPVPPSSNFDLQFIPETSKIVWTLEKAVGSIRDDHLFIYDYQSKALKQLTAEDAATDLVPTPGPDGHTLAWLRFYNENKGYVLSGWNDYQGKIIGGEIWLYDMFSGQSTNTHLVGANVRFIP